MPTPGRPGRTRRRFTLLVGVSLTILIAASIAGLAIGSSAIPLQDVVDALTDYDPTNTNHVIVMASRLPRTVLGIVVGVALGLAGGLMQAVTRNPLADPGLLGINAGAALAVVISSFGVVTVRGYLAFAFLGAAIAAVAVYLLGTAHRSQATPVRMALAGAAIAIVIGAFTRSILLSDQQAFSQFRYWAVGSLQGRGFDVILTVTPFIVIGVLLSLLLARSLNAVALGEEASRSLGVNPALTRGGSALAVVLLAGAATAAAGPIAFVGLAAPHIVRAIVGPDQRLLIPATVVDLIEQAAPSFDSVEGIRLGALDAYVRPQGDSHFDLLASDEDPTRQDIVGAANFRAVHEILSRFYRLILLDTGNNIRAEHFTEALQHTDQLVIPVAAGRDSAAVAQKMMRSLNSTGHRDLVRGAVVLLHDLEPAESADPGYLHVAQDIAADLEPQVSAVIPIPFDPALKEGAAIAHSLRERVDS